MDTERTKLLSLVEHHLHQWHADGVDWLPLKSVDLQNALKALPEPTVAQPNQKSAAAVQVQSLQPQEATASPRAARGDDSIEKIAADLVDCKRCRLCEGRKNIVISRGHPKATLMFIGEGPGADEDRLGEPFVGQAGQLLDKIIGSMGFARDEVYIANVVKCRPPKNRNPQEDEIAACSPFLMRQIEQVAPQIICTLGTFATQTLLKTDARISSLRGRFHEFAGRKLMPTFHPAFLLRNPGMKRVVWDDVKKICKELGRAPVTKAKEPKRA